MADNQSIGVIKEQGFPAGNGLGFTPLTEAEKQKIEQEMESREKETKK